MKLKKRLVVRRERPAARGRDGSQLIELLVAVGIFSVVLLSILQALSVAHNQSTATQNQLFASNLAGELMDDVRNARWSVLQDAAARGALTSASGEIVINRVANQSIAPHPLHPRPLLIDEDSNAAYTIEGTSNRFRGEIRETFAPQGTDAVMVTITVTWPAENGRGRKQFTASTVVNQFGIRNAMN